MQETRSYKRPFFNDENTDLKIVQAKITTKASLVARYSRLVQALSAANYNDVICLNEYAPSEKWKRHKYMKSLTVPCKIAQFTHTAGRNNIKVDTVIDTNELFRSSVKVRDDLLKDLPIYHT